MRFITACTISFMNDCEFSLGSSHYQHLSLWMVEVRAKPPSFKLGKVWETPPSFKVLLKFPLNLWRFWQSNNVFWMIWVWKLIEVCFNSNLCKESHKTEAFKGILPLLWFEVRIPPLFIEGKSLGLCVGMSFKLSKDDNFRWLYQIIIG